jgi:transcriptional regulator GlxA family with amidase domain
MASSHRVVLVAFDALQTLDLTGPMEVFWAADRLGLGSYETAVAGPSTRPIETGSGLRITPDLALAADAAPIDTLLVAGGLGVRAAEGDRRFVDAIAAAAARSRRVTSVCTGAFLLAQAGILEGRRVTTHWASADLLASEHPSVEVEPDRIFVRDGDVWTSAGVTAGIDLALALVEEDHGRDAALEVARWLVVFAKRPGGQTQFSAALSAQTAERAPIREAQERVQADPAAPLTVEMLADGACMSVRNFARAFKRDVGMTPAAYVEAVRVERARQLLETTATGTEQVALACGFGTVETFRRAFRRRLGVSPGQYRDRFRGVDLGAA